MLRNLVIVALLALLGACRGAGTPSPTSGANSEATTVASASASPADGGAAPGECPARACGPQMGMPTRICPDGVHSSGPTGRCIKKEGGVCGWEMATCP